MIECSQKVRSVCPYGETCGGGEYKEGSDCDKFAERLQNKKAHNPGGDPITREQVEKVWGIGAWEMVADEGFVDTMGRQVFHLHCPMCDFFWRETRHKKYFKFCPACGTPMTDEAVQMVMERLEALKDGKGD